MSSDNKIVISIDTNERYPEYEMIVHNSDYEQYFTIELDIKTYNKYCRIIDQYNKLQDDLEILWRNSRNAN